MSDTNEISKGCLTHYDNRHIQVRHDFLGLCAYDKAQFEGRRKEEPNQECMAKIIRLLETLTDHAKTDWQIKALKARDKGLTVPQEPKEYPIELTNGVIVALMYNTFGESTVRNSLDYLVHAGYIGRRQDKKNVPPFYWLHLTKIQALLKEQAEKELSGFENTPLNSQGLKIHPKRPKSNPKPAISNPDPPKLDPSGFESTDNNNSNKDNTTEKDKKDSFASPVVDAEPSEEIPVISKQTPSASPAAAPDLPLAPPSKPEPAASGNENETHSQLSTSYPPEPKATTKWGTRKCLAWFDYWRGGILIGKYKNGQASNCAKGLAEQFDEATVIQIRDRMAAQQYWIDRGGPDVCDVANNIHKELKKVRTKGQPPTSKTDVELVEYEGERMTRDEAMARGYSDFDRYIGNGKAEREALVADAMKDPLFWEIMNDGKEPVQV